MGHGCNPAQASSRTARRTAPTGSSTGPIEEVQRIADGKGQYVLTARTTVDQTLQRQADEALMPALSAMAATIISTPAPSSLMETDGKVRAITGGPDYGESQFNRATHAKRQPGSSFKVYVYATAMENGYTPDTRRARRLALVRKLVAVELRRRRRIRRAHTAVDGAREIAQHRRRGTVLRRRARQGHRDDASGSASKASRKPARWRSAIAASPFSSIPAASRRSPTAASCADPYAILDIDDLEGRSSLLAANATSRQPGRS